MALAPSCMTSDSRNPSVLSPLESRCSGYIDDSIFFAASKEEAERVRDLVLADLAKFGIVVNAQKANLAPAQCVTYLGYMFDASVEPRLFVPGDKLERLLTDVRGYLSDVRQDPERHFRGTTIASLVGRLLSMRHALSPVRVATRELIACLRQLPLVTNAHGHQLRDFSADLQLTRGAAAELVFWAEQGRSWNGLRWAQANPDVVIYTDASSAGWGALALDVHHGLEQDLVSWDQGAHPEGLSEHSLRTELHGILQALIRMQDTVRGKTVRHRTDSLGTFYGLRNGGFNTGELSDVNDLVRRIWLVCCRLDVNLQPEYVGKDVIIRSGAEELSRRAIDDSTTLLRPYFLDLVSKYGWPQADLFASPETVQRDAKGKALPYFSKLAVEDKACIGVDALVHTWPAKGYAFPPLHLGLATVEKALSCAKGTRTIVVLPDWAAQPATVLAEEMADDMLDLDWAPSCTETAPGQLRPIETDATWNRTRFRAYLLCGRV